MGRILLLILFCVPSVAFAAENRWYWIKAGNNIDHSWDVSRGGADVEIKNGQFTAKLLWEGSGKDVKITLKGSIINGRLVVRETIHNSDYSGSTYTGTLVTKKWPEGTDDTIGVETITLSDGLGMIGLTRTIKKPGQK